MSMITEQIKRLREKAELFKKSGFAVDGIVFEFEEAANTIEELSAKLHAANMERSSQYNHGGWIPCEDRMPEDNQDVLVQMSDYSMMVDYRMVSSPEWFWAEENDSPVAWRPLPEPYKAESDG